MSPPAPRALVAEAGSFARSNLASAAATAVDWGVVTVALGAGAHYLAAAAAGALAGAACDFALKRQWAFARAAKDAIPAEALRYLLVSAASMGWNLLAAWALVGGLGLAPLPGVVAASLLVGAAWNYPLHRLWVFPARRA